jgi:hypothetical protein
MAMVESESKARWQRHGQRVAGRMALWLALAWPVWGETVPPPAGKRLLVIGRERFEPALRDFLAHKRRWLPADFRSLEGILKDTQGADDSEKLKRFLHAQWRDRGLGDCWADGVRFYHRHERLAGLRPDDGWYPPSVFFQGMKFMLFGDPSLRLPSCRR